jgi:FAD/FMN-containing dehydrogenase
MRRRTFCKSTLAAAIAATLPACQPGSKDVGSMISAISMDGNELSIESAAVSELAESLQGRLLLQADEGYADAKQVWNGMFDAKQPAMVVQCGAVQDIVNAVTFARERGLLLSVKCGGHSLPGKSTSDGGMMIDLSRMHSADVDAESMTARVDGGALLGHIDNATIPHNLLTTTGIVSHTGAGGFTLAATIVTASGEVLRTSEEENADLFWGIRGGGGNFGIATEFVYRLHPFDPMPYGGALTFKLDKDFLELYAELAQTLPDEANVEPSMMIGEDGALMTRVEFVYCGDHAMGEKLLAPFQNFTGLVDGQLGPMSYSDIQTGADGLLGHGRQYYLKSGYLRELTPEIIEIMLEQVKEGGNSSSWFQHLGGASSRVASDTMAFSHRDVGFNFGIMYFGDDPDKNEAGIAACRRYYKAMEPHMAGFYTNLNDESEKKTWGNYGNNYPRLVELKNKYDPTNLFRLNANIRPDV